MGRNLQQLTRTHSLLAVLEAVVVGSHGQGALTVINHRAVGRGGLILNKLAHLSNSHNSNHDHHSGHPINIGNNGNHDSDSNFNNNTTVSADNNCIVNGLIAELGARMTTGPMQSGGIRWNLRLPPMHPWEVFLDVGGATD